LDEASIPSAASGPEPLSGPVQNPLAPSLEVSGRSGRAALPSRWSPRRGWFGPGGPLDISRIAAERREARRSWRSAASIGSLGLGLAVGGLLVVGLALRWGLDPLIAAAFGRWKPRLEGLVGRALGHPLELGPYRGFGPDGLRLGASRFRPGPLDASTVAVSGLVVRPLPLASWRQRALVLDLRGEGVQVDLRRNARGRVWELGQLPPGGEPPRISLSFHLPDPSRLRLWGYSVSGQPLLADLRGDGQVVLHEHRLEVRSQLTVPGRGGMVQLRGEGDWKRNLWQLQTVSRRFGIGALQPLLPRPWNLDGAADGQVRLRLDQGRPSCDGSLLVRRFRWQPRDRVQALSSDGLPLRCQARTLTLAEAPWRYGPWSGRIAAGRAADGLLNLRLSARPPAGHPLAASLASAPPLRASLRGRWRAGVLAVEELEGRYRSSLLRASGRVGRQLALRGGWWLDPTDLPDSARLPDWLRRSALQGSLQADGSAGAPSLALRSSGIVLPLVGPAQLALSWSDGLLRLQQLSAVHLEASGTMPLAQVPGRGLVSGPIRSRFRLRDFPLQRLNPLVGTQLQGRIDAQGELAGTGADLRPNLWLRLRNPAVGPLRLQETWSGTLSADAGSGLLRLAAEEPGAPGRLEAQLDRRWQPTLASLDRGGGRLTLQGSPERYAWRASSFPLRGLALALGSDPALRSLQGRMGGEGSLELRPLAFNGALSLDRPSLLGVSGRSLVARMDYRQRRYSLTGSFEPLLAGRLEGSLQGRWDGPFQARLQGRHLGAAFFRELLGARDRWLGGQRPPLGQASDLGGLAIETLGRSINDQLRLLAEMRQLAAQRDRQLAELSRAERLQRLQTAIDADLILRGTDPKRAWADLEARGHLWLEHQDRDTSLAADPFVFRLRGPLSGGEGRFDLAGFSLALLPLLTPVPVGLRGSLSAQGSYRLGGGPPRIGLDLALAGGAIGGQELVLQKGRLELVRQALAVKLALRSKAASQGLTMEGTIPLDPDRKDLLLYVASRDDGLLFLSRLAGAALDWRRGTANLRLRVGGSLREPSAEGSLSLRDGECQLAGQTLKAVQATVLFDTSVVEVKGFTARVGSAGRIRAEGRLGLVRPLEGPPSLALELQAVPFAMPRVNARAEGRMTVAGSLLAPRLGGTLAIGHGKINVQPAGLAAAPPGSEKPPQPTTLPRLLESQWDFRDKLVLLGPDVESAASLSLEQTIPRLSWLSFDGLQVRLGPDLRVVLPNVASFSTGGGVRISGRLDPSLRAAGVVRLLQGRLNLFTTNFSLDPDAPNVAVFTPSLGLIPYLDIALRTRIADSLHTLAPSGLADAEAVALANTQLAAQGGFSSLSQLSLILVTVSVSGPADRIADNLRLRSSPPLPQERLVALIGGNSLAGLGGGEAGTALATALGQSLLSPLLSTLSDALGQRVSMALYPTYVTPQVSSIQQPRSRTVPPQLVFGAEVGFDISERFNASLLAAPNRSDIPPQVTLNYRASERVNLEASVDTQGSWQSQLRVFFRF
jgi:translocation and assembly module TamB